MFFRGFPFIASGDKGNFFEEKTDENICKCMHLHIFFNPDIVNAKNTLNNNINGIDMHITFQYFAPPRLNYLSNCATSRVSSSSKPTLR